MAARLNREDHNLPGHAHGKLGAVAGVERHAVEDGEPLAGCRDDTALRNIPHREDEVGQVCDGREELPVLADSNLLVPNAVSRRAWPFRIRHIESRGVKHKQGKTAISAFVLASRMRSAGLTSPKLYTIQFALRATQSEPTGPVTLGMSCSERGEFA